jgi:hypothetical protein
VFVVFGATTSITEESVDYNFPGSQIGYIVETGV